MESTLKRVAFSVQKDTAQYQLASKAAKLLGYQPLAIKEAVPLGELGEALALLEIEPFDRDTVAKYKIQKRDEETGRLAQIARTITRNRVQTAEERTALNVHMGYSKLVWTQVPISEYRQPIPEFVLSKAVQIKELVPEATIWVDHLHIEHIPRSMDPFLIVQLGQEAYCVEVWDEPKFEERVIDQRV